MKSATLKVGNGKVWLVGAGPGDPGLITVKGAKCLAQAQVVVFDFLAGESLLKEVSPSAEVIYVGKKGGDHTLPQEEINRLIIKKAREGKTVVRLKGGDPFIFGRGGEEAEELARAGIPFEIVPGVTSAIAVPAYAGIPLTHRAHTSAVTFATGHEDPLKDGSRLNYQVLAQGGGTLVFLMGIKNLTTITRNLLDHGKPPETPAAVIRWGTTPEQETLVGTLRTIGPLVREKGLKPPGILVVGEVVRLRESLNWYESRPLFGRTILVTRTREQASIFAQYLEDLGARVIQFPTIEVVPPRDWGPLDKALARLKSFDWVLFTSQNGVRFFFERLTAGGKDVRALASARLGCIGEKTAWALKEKGFKVDLIPDAFQAEGLIAALARRRLKGKRILIPRAKEAREILPEELARRGAKVTVVAAYETRMPRASLKEILPRLEAGDIGALAFTSSSTVRNFCKMMGKKPLESLKKRMVAACIGPVTRKTAEQAGFLKIIQSEPYTVEALAQTLAQYFSRSA